MTDILAQIGTEVGSEIKNLDIRLSSAENAIVNLGGQTPPPTGNFTIEPVTWTNLSEINLSGEKLLNTDFDLPTLELGVEVVVLTGWSNGGKIASVGQVYVIDLVQSNGGMRLTNSSQSIFASASQMQNNVQANTPANWSVSNGTLDQDKLSQGIIKGFNSSVGVQQMFSNPIASGTALVAKVTRNDTNESGTVHVQTLRANGTPFGGNKNITFADGFVEFETTETAYGIRLTTHGDREVSSISLFQGEVSGGSVQTFTGGSIEKISGVDGYNAGASSVQKIDGQKDGYVQFQIGHATRSVRVGLVNQDSDYEVDIPFKLNFGGGKIDFYQPFLDNQKSYESGDWFRIRHYSANNEIHFQKREDIYQANTTNSYEVGTKILILRDFSSAIKDEIVTVYLVGSSGVPSFEQEDGTRFGAQAGISGFGRTDWWEVAESIGQDYVTFYTHPVFSNGNDLFVDASLHTVGSRLNDCLLAT
tara:strand:+ start:216 stop:1643 length:1428 start_codon:yes stop_codon:yes gene_type:complete